ncbi:acyl-CoA-associated DUF35 OB-fold domain-containing protein [Paraburkholderia sp. BL10I2N1]|nr:acyl-CoA-associated DUF35 OB-fold domain-containing protein [Paraburkholderia sp. BL10I2N1]
MARYERPGHGLFVQHDGQGRGALHARVRDARRGRHDADQSGRLRSRSARDWPAREARLQAERGRIPGADVYALAYVTLDEGVTMLTNLVDCDPAALEIGQRVKLVFKPSEGGYPVPMFTPA